MKKKSSLHFEDSPQLAAGSFNKKLYEIHADICKTLANAKRIEILTALEGKELTVSELAHTQNF